jgi:cytoskeletal protein RodZ
MKSNQRGGVVSFVIVALALAGLLGGGLYLSKHQARLARDGNTTTPQVTITKPDNKKDDSATKKPEETTVKPATTEPRDSTTQQPAATTPKPTPATTTPAAQTPATNRVANTGPSEPLPETGPSEVVVVTIGLSALAFTGYRLLQSRRSLQRAALKQ